ncbi:MAG TPA: AAA family ATPase [Nitrosospira sp.]|nr:AAA family ATPase [Nitrosospira sp.]
MRFQRLDLIKYGKFSGCTIDFPAARWDFHLIVGPNEAGKSTLRAAIVDLLFGMPYRSPLDFLHPLSELRLGAHISNKSGFLEFHRIKAQKQSLRSLQDASLTDTVLDPFLGTADRNFFDQMFGLDHKKLVDGGNSILSAENDVGQVLFQAAAGVANLGKVRDALVAEADKLWTPRKSAGKEYYIAARQLEEANTALKHATVRTREWAEASREAERLRERIGSENAHHGRLQAERTRLERIRRLAPLLRIFRENEKQLSALGEAPDLPPDAGAILLSAEQDFARANQLLELGNRAIEKTKRDLEEIRADEAVLAIAADIRKLDELRLRYGAHERDIDRRETEKSALWNDIRSACTQLGWQCNSEEMVAGHLPTLIVRRELGQLARDHSGLMEGLRATEKAERDKLSEIKSLADQLHGLQPGEIDPALRAVLEKMKLLGDPDAEMRKKQAVLAKRSDELEISLQRLGQWSMSPSSLAEIKPPSQKKISRVAQDRQLLVADRRAASMRRDDLKRRIAETGLKISQLKNLHHISTRQEVLQARSERDAAWSAIKKGEVDLQQGTERFETALFHADEVSDIRFDNVEKATELQSLQHQLEREGQELSGIENQHAYLNQEIGKLDAHWSELMLATGLDRMPLDDIVEWLVKRETALAAGVACQEAEDDCRLFSLTVTALRDELVKELGKAGVQADEADSLSALGMRADSFIKSIDAAEIERKTLSTQLYTTQASITTLRQAAETARAAVSLWTHAWSNALEKAALPAGISASAVEGALDLIQDIEKNLRKMRELQADRIDVMRADLDELAVEADRLARIAAPEAKGEPAAQIIQLLAKRLAATQEAAAEAVRLKKVLHDAKAQVGQAEELAQTATASLQPLMERAGTDSNASLRRTIAQSDECRRLREEVAEARTNLLEAGDGLALEQIGKECDGADPAQLAAALMQIESQISEAVTRQNVLSADYANSSRTLAEIGGSDAAAQAEAQRQQAISRMSDVAERYVKVMAAARLLRWSIERYREEKQGPLLTRAGTLFSKLTLGSFDRLVVDFEQQPMVLQGLRPSGELVGIAGMSDGTRDQLYLALRLAALELHVGQATPLPFIADDLFINYDDARSEAGLEALKGLSEQIQIIFLTHHAHLVPSVQRVFGKQTNIVRL